MKVGDLVKVSNKGFSAIGYITKVCDASTVLVRYLAQLGKHTDPWSKGGLWSSPYITLLKEVKHEEDTGKT